jgi:two-component system KDP operon response regulator KdpE
MTAPGPLIQIIEDEPPLRRLLRASLMNEKYRVNEAASGEEGLRVASSQPPDAVLLDLGLPDLDGQEVLRRLREWFAGPVIVLSARDQEQQKILALENGADDYVTKPFSVGELLARIRTSLRHVGPAVHEASVITLGNLRIDLGARLVYRDGKEIHLTPLEYKLLITLAKHAGKVLTHHFLLREVWGPEAARQSHYLRVFVASLRRKLETDPARPQYLLTEQGIGYRFAEVPTVHMSR